MEMEEYVSDGSLASPLEMIRDVFLVNETLKRLVHCKFVWVRVFGLCSLCILWRHRFHTNLGQAHEGVSLKPPWILSILEID